MRAVRSCLTIFGFASIFLGLMVMSPLITGAMRGQF
jgi:hypothetical protein